MTGRRKSLLFALALSIVLLSGSISLPVDSAQQSTATPIKHLIILMMENHSFDNIFGAYGLNGNGTLARNVTLPLNLVTNPVNQKLSAVPTGQFSTSDPYEGYSNYHTDWNNGSMNGFLNGSGPNSMTYFTASQMGLEWAFAQEFSLADNYFSNTLSETLPNRLYSLAGFSPVKADQLTPPPFVPYSQTIFYEMDSYNVSWNYYFQNPALGVDPFYFIYGFEQHLSHIQTWNNFVGAVNNGTLPDVSWVSPISGGAFFYSQHPPDNVLSGELWLFYIIHLIMDSRYWSSTAIMITYDEGGGYYDQVAPPVIHGKQLGFRVPFILISPYAKEDYVSNTVMTHTSMLAFIDYNWNMPALNALVEYSNLPLDMFNFNSPYASGSLVRSPLSFNSTELAYLPASIGSSTSLSGSFTNVSNVFPMKFQYNVSSLPYATSGKSDFNLSQASSQVFVTYNYAYTPWFLNTYITVPGAIISIGLVSFGVFTFIRKRRAGKK